MFDEVTNDYVPIMLTDFEYKRDGNRLYSLETMDITQKEKSAGQLVDDEQAHLRQTPIADFVKKITKVIEEIKSKDHEKLLTTHTDKSMEAVPDVSGQQNSGSCSPPRRRLSQFMFHVKHKNYAKIF